MSAAQLLTHFDRLSEAPDAVPRLRRFILDLAVRGKLVKQEAGDEHASELLKRVSAEWDQLHKSGLGQRGKGVTDLSDTDGPFGLPNLWMFVCLGEVLQMFNGRAFKPTEWKTQGLPIVRIQNLNNPNATFNYCDPAIVDDRHRINDGDFLISWSGTPGTSFGAFIWDRGAAALNQHIFRCVQVGAAFVPRFLRLAINTQLNVLISQAQGGVGLQHVTKGTLEKLPLALPPLAEQRRIVAKVDEMMAVCDKLEKAQKERESQRDRLVATSLARLNRLSDAMNRDKQRDDVDFHLQNLFRLTTRVEHINALRKTILNLAVQGLLSQSDSWSLHLQPQELRTAATLQNGYAFKSEWFTKSGIRLLRNTNVGHGTLHWDDLVCLPQAHGAEYERFQLKEGDVVLSLDRPFIGTGTKVARVRATDLPCLLLQRVGRFRVDPNLLTTDYLFLWIESPQFTEQVDPGRSNGVPHISSKQVENAVISLPSLTEQARIVARVNELMTLCDQLAERITVAQEDRRRLLETTLDRALGIVRVEKKGRPVLRADAPALAIQDEGESRYMPNNPAITEDQLLICIDDLGGEATPDRLLMQAGLSDDVEAFYDLLRAARDGGKVLVHLGSGEKIRRVTSEN